MLTSLPELAALPYPAVDVGFRKHPHVEEVVLIGRVIDPGVPFLRVL